MECLGNNSFASLTLVFFLLASFQARPFEGLTDKNLRSLLLEWRREQTHIWEFTFVVFVKVLEKRCTGSILSELWVLTSRFCYSDVKSDESKVLAGNRFLDTEDEDKPGVQVRVIQDLFLNPLICTPDCARKHDIMMVKVKKHFEFNQYVSPVQLASLDKWPKHYEEQCTVVSFGSRMTSGLYGMKTVSDVILKHPDRCGNLNSAYLNSDFVCTRSLNENGACLGDSGGPVLCGGYLVAITHSYVPDAFDPRQCPSKAPVEVFTLLGQYRNWILNFEPDTRFVNWATRSGAERTDGSSREHNGAILVLSTFVSLYAWNLFFL